MTSISPRDPDGSLALNPGALPIPAKASKKLSPTLAALTARVVTAATLALVSTPDVQARTQMSSVQTIGVNAASNVKDTKKKLNKNRKKSNSSIIQINSQGWATLEPRVSGYSNISYSSSQIAPIGGIAANNILTVPLGTSSTRVTALEQEQRATTLAKIQRIQARPISYTDLKNLVKTLDERDRLAIVFPLSATLSYTNSTEKLAIGEMLQVMLYDPDPKLHANPKDALSNFKRLSVVTGQLDRAEQIKNTYFEKGSPEYRAMTAVLAETRRASDIAAIAKGLPVKLAQESPFTHDLPGLKPESFSIQNSPQIADFRNPSYKGQRANLPAPVIKQTPVMVPPAVVTSPIPGPTVVIWAPALAPAPIAKASPPWAKSRVSSAPNPIANRAQLTLPGVEKASPPVARVKSVDTAQAIVFSQHAEAFSKLPSTAVLSDAQTKIILHPNFVDRSHVILDFLTRPRLTKVDGKLVVTHSGDLSTQKAREFAVSDTDRALYIAGALEMLIGNSNAMDRALLGRTPVIETFRKVILQAQPPQGEARAHMRTHIELSLMILYASGNPKNIAFAESALKILTMELGDAYLQDLAASLVGVADRPMSTENWIPGRLRALVNFVRTNTSQKN